jgi:hypothetical protein
MCLKNDCKGLGLNYYNLMNLLFTEIEKMVRVVEFGIRRFFYLFVCFLDV